METNETQHNKIVILETKLEDLEKSLKKWKIFLLSILMAVGIIITLGTCSTNTNSNDDFSLNTKVQNLEYRIHDISNKLDQIDSVVLKKPDLLNRGTNVIISSRDIRKVQSK